MDERRKDRRLATPLDCDWALFNGSYAHTRLSDISAGGCFVESRVSPVLGETIEITITLLDTPTTLRGVVVSVDSGIGFALQFAPLDKATSTLLETFLETAFR